MKQNIKVLLFLLLALLIISILAFAITRIKKTEILNNKERKKVFELNETNVTKYVLEYSEDTITVENKNGTWFIVSPTNYYADQMEAFANVKNFNTLMISMIITNLEEKDSFGFDDKSQKFTVYEKNKGVDKEYAIYIGAKTPDDEGYYVRYNNEYFSLESVFIDALKKDVTMLRDKDFLKIRFPEVVGVVVQRDNDTNTIAKIKSREYIIEGVENSDIDKVFLDFQTLAKVQAEGFSEDIEYITKEKPQATVNIYMEDKTKTGYNIFFVDSKTYVKPLNMERVFEVNYAIYDTAMRDKNYYISTKTNTASTNMQ